MESLCVVIRALVALCHVRRLEQGQGREEDGDSLSMKRHKGRFTLVAENGTERDAGNDGRGLLASGRMANFDGLPAELRLLVIRQLFYSRLLHDAAERRLNLRALLFLSMTCSTIREQAIPYIFNILRFTPNEGLTPGSKRYLEPLGGSLRADRRKHIQSVLIHLNEAAFTVKIVHYLASCLTLLPPRTRDIFLKFSGLSAETSAARIPLFFSKLMQILFQTRNRVYLDWDRSICDYIRWDLSSSSTQIYEKLTDLIIVGLFDHSVLQFAHRHFRNLQHFEFTMDYDMNYPFVDTLHLWPTTLRSFKLSRKSEYPTSSYQVLEIIKASAETLESIHLDCVVDCSSFLEECPRLRMPNLKELKLDRSLVPYSNHEACVDGKEHVQKFFDCFIDTPIVRLYLGLRKGDTGHSPVRMLRHLVNWPALEEIHVPLSRDRDLIMVNLPQRTRIVAYSSRDLIAYVRKDVSLVIPW
ncbi:hypothetical protein BT69DRAFT_1379966 [Atractiella rhizophila]|nr:hypothetical protein BT69DRAFT_1379966 [Atractiella rhizophila]